MYVVPHFIGQPIFSGHCSAFDKSVNGIEVVENLKCSQDCNIILSNSLQVLAMSPSNQEIAAKAQQGVLDSIPAKWKLPQIEIMSNVMEIPKSCGILTSKQIEVTEQTATELLEKLANGSLSSVEVTEAFLARAAIAHQLVFILISQIVESIFTDL